MRSELPSLAGVQILEHLQCVWLIWEHRPSGGRVFGDGNGAPVNMNGQPVDGNRQGARDLGHRPEVMAAFRHTAIGLMHWAGDTNIAVACRRFAAQPWSALDLIRIIPEN